MFINNLAVEGNKDLKMIMNPTWDQVKEFILSLDGYDYSVVSLNKGKIEENGAIDVEEFMSIAGGGKNSLYTCDIYSYKTGQKFMIDPKKSDDKLIEITDVFFSTKVEENRCFYLNDILVVAETYARFGKADETLSWQTD